MFLETILNVLRFFYDGGLFYDKGPYHTETSPFICYANQWIDFYMIEAVINENSIIKKSQHV